MATEQELALIKRRHSAHLLQLPGVCGVGIEKGESGDYVLAVHLDANDPNAGKDVPETIEGQPIKRVLSGPFTKF
jgi:hypothetical protein